MSSFHRPDIFHISHIFPSLTFLSGSFQAPHLENPSQCAFQAPFQSLAHETRLFDGSLLKRLPFPTLVHCSRCSDLSNQKQIMCRRVVKKNKLNVRLFQCALDSWLSPQRPHTVALSYQKSVGLKIVTCQKKKLASRLLLGRFFLTIWTVQLVVCIVTPSTNPFWKIHP